MCDMLDVVSMKVCSSIQENFGAPVFFLYFGGTF